MKRMIILNLLMIGVLTAGGCAGVHNSMIPSDKSSPWNVFKRKATEKKDGKKKKEGPPENMVVIWKDALLEKPGTPSVRGFGARIYFHDAKNEAVKAEGELIVYGFDDFEKDAESSPKKPSKKFVFTNDQFQSHYSESDLGASYSVWIPWEKIGGYRKTIALIPVFKTSDGRVLNGGSSNNVLPGKAPDNDNNIIATDKNRNSKTNGSVALAGFSTGGSESKQINQAVLNEDAGSESRIRTSTINLTPSMASLFATPTELSPNGETKKGSIPINEPKKNALQPPPEPNNSAKKRTAGTENRPSEPNSETPNELNLTTDPTTSRRSPSVFGAPGSFR